MNVAHDAPSALPPQLAAVDLNLLVSFDTLARERSVTRAAERAGVTQSAMSHTLRRLRELLGDPLLVRGRAGWMLTPRAESLMVPLRSGLVTLGRALAEPDAFHPQASTRSFCVASPDLFDVLAIPALLARIHRDAPGVDIAVVPAGERRIADDLETGAIDLAIVPRLEQERRRAGAADAPGLVRRTIFRDRFVCFLRAGHPALGRKRGRGAASGARISLKEYASLSHALVSPAGAGRGPVDEVLERHGLSRRIALRVPQFYSALAIVAQSDLVLTAPTGLARLVSAEQPVVALPVPVALPEHSVQMLWHERFGSDPGHRWLRDLVAEVGRTMTDPSQAVPTTARARGDAPLKARSRSTRPGYSPASGSRSSSRPRPA